MQDKDSNIVLDTGIGYNKSIQKVWRGFERNIVKKTNISFEVIIALLKLGR